MESIRNTGGINERYVVTLEQRGAERGRSRCRRNDETPECTYLRRSVQHECQQRRQYLETVEQKLHCHVVGISATSDFFLQNGQTANVVYTEVLSC